MRPPESALARAWQQAPKRSLQERGTREPRERTCASHPPIQVAGYPTLVRLRANLIHPGKTTRTGQMCDRGTALSAVGALVHVVRDLANPWVGTARSVRTL